MRNNNIEYGNKANGKIINYLKSLDGFVSIHEIRDNQQNRNSLQGMERLENDINMHLGIDYVLVMKDKTYYIDTKGFNYNQKNCGVDPISHTQYEMWYGEEETYTAKSIEEVMSVPLFNGKSINEIYTEIEITDVY